MWTDKRKEKIPRSVEKWRGDFIFSYHNYWLIKKNVIDSANIMAVNFHPGTPELPGSGSYNWAIYLNKKKFGTTIHLMNEKIDNGKILRVKTFRIDKKITLEKLIKKSDKFRKSTFINFISFLNKQNSFTIKQFLMKNRKHFWSRKARKISDLDKIKTLNFNLSYHEIKKRVRAFHTDKYPVTLNFKKFKFILVNVN